MSEPLSPEAATDGPSAAPSFRDANQALTGLVVLVIALLGAPQVWGALRDRDFGPELVYFPVLLVALGHLALRGRTR